MLTINVRLLDGSVFTVSADRKDKGEIIFDQVCEHLFLEEKDYFGLQYEDKTGLLEWVELDKRLGRLFKAETWEFLFAVKFYPPDPSQLQEDVTRYQLCLQVRNDILSGKLPCSFPTYAMLASYLVQSQIGDYSPEEHSDTSYLQGFRFAPEADHTPELEAKIVELHRTHKGQTPAEADLHYLENAKKLAMYGVDFHPAKDSEGVDLTLGVCSTGLQVYRQMLRINRFAWPKILKISYKRNNFYIKIRPGNYEQIENTVGFKLADHRSAKRLWKRCVEHHTFFRLMTPEDVAKPGLLPRLSSRYRYSRRTQYMTKQSTIDRDQPTEFRKSIRGVPIREVPSSKSLDPLMPQQNNDDSKENKRHTMSHPPQRIPGVDPSPKKDKKPVGGVAVLPTDLGKKKRKESPLKEAPEKENGVNDSDEEKENRDSVKKTKSPIGFGRFIGGKDKKSKGDKLEEMGVVREYEYEEKEEEKKKRMKGFSYEKKSGDENKDEDGAKSPSKISKAKAFNYSPKKDEGFGIFKKKREEDKDESIEMKNKEKKGFLSSLKRPESPESKKDDNLDKNKEKKSFLSSLKKGESPESKDVKNEETVEEKIEKDKKSINESSESKTGKKDDTLEGKTDKGKDKKGFLSSLKRPESPESKGLDDKKKDEKKKYGFLSNLTHSIDKKKDKDKLNSSDLEKKDELNTSTESKTDEKKLGTSSDKKKSKEEKKSLDTSLTKKDDKKKDSDKNNERKDSSLIEKNKDKDDKKKTDSSIDKKEKDSKKKLDTSVDKNKEKDDKKKLDSSIDKNKEKDDKKKLDSSIDKKKDDKKSDKKSSEKSKEKDDKKKDKDSKKSLETSIEKKDDKKLHSPDAEKKKDRLFGFLSKKPGSPDAKNKDKNKDRSELEEKKGSKNQSESVENKNDSKKGTKNDTLENGKTDDKTASESFILAEGKGPKIVKTTTKQSLVKDGGNTTRNIEEKIEDMETGDITLNSEESQLEDTTGSPYVTATAVTTRTAMTTEDLGTNAKTSQVEEKTVARTTTHSGTRQEQRVVTQEVRATTVVSEPQDFRRSSMSSTSSDDSGTPIDGDFTKAPGTKEPIVETESVFLVPEAGDGQKMNSSPFVPASASLIGPVSSETVVTGEIVSSQMITSKSRTVETVTYKTEKDGVVETRVEQKITIQSDGDPIDHDKALAEAIQEATAMNPDMQVEKIEIQQESLPN